MAFLSTKTYSPERGLSCAYRQWAAPSHCSFLHGYALGFRFTFAAEQLDARGWVVDFGPGGFGEIRAWLHGMFDHTLLIAEDGPARAEFMALGQHGLAQTRLVPGTSCEALAAHVWSRTQPMIAASTQDRCWIASVECLEMGPTAPCSKTPTRS